MTRNELRVTGYRIHFSHHSSPDKVINMFNTIEETIEAMKNGEMVIIVDDEDRENEGDLIMAAEKVTPEAINFMAKNGRGLI